MKLFDTLSDNLADWALRQPMFFTGSASTHGSHVNISPKGLSSTHFSVLSPNKVAYIDRTGSGVETISHAYENGRLCIMFISFGDTPRILRLFCRSTVVEWCEPSFPSWINRVSGGQRVKEGFAAARAVIVCDVFQVQTSCGYGVPRVKKALYAPKDEDGEVLSPHPEIASILHEGGADGDGRSLSELAVFEERPTLDEFWTDRVEKNKVIDYQQLKNITSMDGLPGLRVARQGAGYSAVADAAKIRWRRLVAERESVGVGFLFAILLYSVVRFCLRL